MVERRNITALIATAALVMGACGGGGAQDDTTQRESGSVEGPLGGDEDAGDEMASAQLTSVEFVWAIDGEPVDAIFDYTLPIERDRYEAGLRFDANFVTTGDVGTITPDLTIPVTINGDDIRAGSTMGPERSDTRPERNDVEIVVTDDGFAAQFPIGRPLSPISLEAARRRAIDFGLTPDDEVIDLGADLTFDAAAISDIPAAPQNGQNEFVIELGGSIAFGNGAVLDVGEGLARSETIARLTIGETTNVSLSTVADCAAQTERYLELFAEELAEPDTVLLDRLRAFGTIATTVRENECGPRDFAIPVCDAATASPAPEPILDRHLAQCPDELELIEAEVFEPRFENGVIQLVVPSTRDGLPAFSVAMSFPATWEIETTSEGSNRQKIALSADPETVGRFTRLDIDVSTMPSSLLDERAAAAVAPTTADAVIVRADETTIGGVPARRLIAQNAPDSDEFQIGTAVKLDTERLLTITGGVTHRPELPVDGNGLAVLLDCIEASIVIVGYEAGVDPVPAGDCTDILSLSASTEAITDPADPAAEAAPASSFDGSTISLSVPGSSGGPSHVVTFATPAWTIGSSRDTETEQFFKLDADEDTSTFVRATAEVTSDYEVTVTEEAAPPFEHWSVVSDETRTLGDRELRVVVMDWTAENTRRGKIIARLDAEHYVVVEVNIDGAGDFEEIFNEALESLTISPVPA